MRDRVLYCLGLVIAGGLLPYDFEHHWWALVADLVAIVFLTVSLIGPIQWPAPRRDRPMEEDWYNAGRR